MNSKLGDINTNVSAFSQKLDTIEEKINNLGPGDSCSEVKNYKLLYLA